MLRASRRHSALLSNNMILDRTVFLLLVLLLLGESAGAYEVPDGDIDGVPEIQPITDEDYEAGYVLAEVQTYGYEWLDERPDAHYCTDWQAFGAHRDWFTLDINGFRGTIFSNGEIRPRISDKTTFYAPLLADQSFVPNDANSKLFYQVESGATIFAWKRSRLDRDPKKQITYFVRNRDDGSIEFHYNLAGLPSSMTIVSNVTVGIQANGKGRTFSRLNRNVSMLRWMPLLGFRDENDNDQDGLSNDNERLYQTDPSCNDCDYDWLYDGEEVLKYGTDPFNSCSIWPGYPDGMMVLTGGADPYSCPPGSTNTVWEHLFYTGTTNAPFAYPESTEQMAVLKVWATGSGYGDVFVGNKWVRLPGTKDGESHKLLVPMARWNTDNFCGIAKDGCELHFDSDDFCFGFYEESDTYMPPGSGSPAKFICAGMSFPRVRFGDVCIHTLDERECEVSVPDEWPSDLQCEWHANEEIDVEKISDRRSVLSLNSNRSDETEIGYTVSHPDYLFGCREFKQTVRFCPKVDDEDLERKYGVRLDVNYHQEIYGVCEVCGHSHEPETPHVYEKPVQVPEYDDYAIAAKKFERSTDVIYIRDPSKSVPINLTCPTTGRDCCSCPEHRLPHVGLAYKANTLDVDDARGNDFSMANASCTVFATPVAPSASVGDAALLFETNGIPLDPWRKTALGLFFSSYTEVPLKRYNELSPRLGYPIKRYVPPDCATIIQLRNRIGLNHGFIQLGIGGKSGVFAVWVQDSDGYKKILDSVDNPTVEMPISEWRALVDYATSSDGDTNLRITSDSTGTAILSCRYWTVADDKLIEDNNVQRVTSVSPMAVVDYDRDGDIDEKDNVRASRGDAAWFWSNEDVWRGDDMFEESETKWLPPGSWSKNVESIEVNGRNDLVNLLPVVVNCNALYAAWGTDKVRYQVTFPGRLRFQPVPTKWNELHNLLTKDEKTLSGDVLHQAKLMEANRDSHYVLPVDFLAYDLDSAGALAIEFIEECSSLFFVEAIDVESNQVLFDAWVPMIAVPVEEMYRWINLYSAADGSSDEWFGDYSSRTDILEWWDPNMSAEPEKELIFVHGYNVAQREGRQWATTIFKRLFRLGLNASFTAVSWQGNPGQSFVPGLGYVTKNYHAAVQNAFLTSEEFSKEVSKLKAPKKYLMAHSLGNMVVSSAIQDHSLNYEKYFMLNAAVALEAYDVASISNETKQAMTPSEWKVYSDRVRSTHWHELFSDSPADSRNKLTWKNRFKDVDRVVNFYSSQEEVLADGDGTWKIPRRKYSWYNQERHRGDYMISFSPEAGWNFGNYYLVKDDPPSGWESKPLPDTYSKYTPEKANAISADSLIHRPFFKRFSEPAICTDGGSDYINSTPGCLNRLLAYGIPAESFAAGAHPVGKWRGQKDKAAAEGIKNNVESVSEDEFSAFSFNIDMSDVCRRDGFNRTKKPPAKDMWGHSYFVGKSLYHTHRLYGKILEEIGE
jgi:hypothetical protein